MEAIRVHARQLGARETRWLTAFYKGKWIPGPRTFDENWPFHDLLLNSTFIKTAKKRFS